MKDSTLDALILADVAIILMVSIAIAPLRARLRQPVVVGEIAAGTGTLLIPVFFALTGLSIDVGALGWTGALELVAFLAVAWAGKFAGTSLGARLIGLSWHDARMLAVFLNTRGLGEVLILTIGRNAGIIDDQVFTAMLVTALLATASVNPLIRRLAARTTASNNSPAALPAQAVRQAPDKVVEKHNMP
ncbi:cation:proton antiporter [Streptomyces triculaminicus]|uniref:cation:proton antiporter domain-containing protein n=1 Tax=Streptomyces triculaminicus TaxID=2816232 RepID=UPI0033FB45D6